MSGWFAVSKEVWDDPIWGEKTPMTDREAYLWLCRNAAWEDTKHRVGSEMVDCPKGSIFITLRDFMATTSWGSDTKIRNFLQRLEGAGLIKRTVHGKRNAQKTRVTICEYSENPHESAETNAPETHRKRTENAVKEEYNNKQTSEANASSDSAISQAVPANDVSEAVAAYNAEAPAHGWPQVQKLTPARGKALKARLKDAGGMDGWHHALSVASNSDFLSGRNGRWSGFCFDWMTKQANFTKLMEGNYDNRNRNNRPQQRGPSGYGSGTADAFVEVARRRAQANS